MSSRIVIALIFTLAWAGVTGSFSIPNLGFGLLLGLAAVWLVRDGQAASPIRVRPVQLARLILLFVVELIKSGVRVAIIVLRRDMRLNPAIIAYPLRVTSDFEIALLANLITLTPGTMSVDVSDDRATLFVHCVDVPDAEAVILDIRNGFERLILEAFR
jgi:multicomponent Na+:H+ antiporter subunit E